jgi:VIT1/CCC1 family predicted Fe2+/Mn2+ transporter
MAIYPFVKDKRNYYWSDHTSTTMKQGARDRHEPESSSPRDLLTHYIGDIVYGGLDGIITTFAVVSGVTGASLEASIVIVLGLANLIADGFSMAASSYLSARSEAEAKHTGRGYVEPIYHATFTFFSFVLIGAVPLPGYLLIEVTAISPFLISCVSTLVALFVVGSLRSIVINRRWYRAGLEMLLIGTLAASIAYGIGFLLKGFA